ncbi:hypothetical protein A7E78_03280 [Syntrophotalea acetylenivorans]|uniref:Uncharacterized protein n=1 Tax=Syntrophotalea acetylenivorans TaxID=1842532 RepID=A0A1L3GLY5_9BACT|nr:hypothetical protein [Syntrophotalea acetylenivorans]APG26939.1 hypothetical protein A7E78_03280 [Syntrophotalea acetylenivorans]
MMISIFNLSMSLKRTYLASVIVALFFLISISGIIFPSLSEWSAKIANRNYNGEGLIEYIEALCWLCSAIIFLMIFLKYFRKNGWNMVAFWLVGFSLFSFVCFGEELSWGQHVFQFETTKILQEYNKQNEFNVHNLNICKICGLPDGDPRCNYLRNFNIILNPLFYLICGIVWFVIPFMKKIGIFVRNKLISTLPSPSLSTAIFCGVNLIAYLLIDKLFFDVGEILELALAFVGLMTPLDIITREDINSGDGPVLNDAV